MTHQTSPAASIFDGGVALDIDHGNKSKLAPAVKEISLEEAAAKLDVSEERILDLITRRIARIGLTTESAKEHRFSAKDLEELKRAEAWMNLPEYMRIGESLTDEEFDRFKARVSVDLFSFAGDD